MSNFFHHIGHGLYEPTVFHRQYDQDFCSEDGQEYTIIKVAQVIIPLVALKKSWNKGLLVALGTLRSGTCLCNAVKSDTIDIKALEVAKAALSVLAVGCGIKNRKLGFLVGSSGDLFGNAVSIYENRAHAEKVQDGVIRAVVSAAHVSTMIFGAQGLRVASLLLITGQHFYEGRVNWGKGRRFEALAALLLGYIRGYHVGHQVYLLFRKGTLQGRCPSLSQNLLQEKKIGYLKQHPLLNYSTDTKGHRALFEVRDKIYYFFGQNHFGYGKGVVKGMNLRFFWRESKALDFKLNHVFREKLNLVIDELFSLSPKECQELLRIKGSDIKEIIISEIDQDRATHGSLGPAYEIHLVGLGKIYVGASRDLPNLYDKVTVVLEEGTDIYDFHKALSFLGLEDALKHSDMDDLERMKLGHLFRLFSPREATAFERTEEFFSLPVFALKEEICRKSPKMTPLFEKFLPKMELQEILPGRKRFVVRGLADELREMGATELSAALTGACEDEELCCRVATILKSGMFSSEMRLVGGVPTGGLSPSMDYNTGGADRLC